jgi:hypothetical protein
MPGEVLVSWLPRQIVLTLPLHQRVALRAAHADKFVEQVWRDNLDRNGASVRMRRGSRGVMIELKSGAVQALSAVPTCRDCETHEVTGYHPLDRLDRLRVCSPVSWIFAIVCFREHRGLALLSPNLVSCLSRMGLKMCVALVEVAIDRRLRVVHCFVIAAMNDRASHATEYWAPRKIASGKSSTNLTR